MRIRGGMAISLVLTMMLGAECAHVISKEISDQMAKGIPFRQVQQNPDGYKGKIFIWGGMIISTKHQKDGTLMEILQEPLDTDDRPETVDRSEGRFLALYQGFLDDAVYAKGREVTVAGEVMDKRTMPLGEMEYTYPVILIKEIYLWPERPKERLVPYPVPYPGPYWGYTYGYDPWWYDPWWYRPWYYPSWRRWR